MQSFSSSKIALLASLGLSVAGCQSYAGVDQGYYFRAGEPITQASLDRQDKEVGPRCWLYAKKTTPSKMKSAGAGAVNGLVGGVIGGGGGAKLGAKVAGARLASGAIPYAMVAYGVASGVGGAINGYVRVGEIRFNKEASCRAQSAGGIIAMAPQQARAALARGDVRAGDMVLTEETVVATVPVTSE